MSFVFIISLVVLSWNYFMVLATDCLQSSLVDASVLSATKLSMKHGGLNNTLNLTEDARFGFALAYIGDIDGNGIGDVAVAAPGTDDVDIVYIMTLDENFNYLNIQAISNTQGGLSSFVTVGGNWATTMCYLGELNGYKTIAVGAPRDNQVFILSLFSNGTVSFAVELSKNFGGVKKFYSLPTRGEFGRSLTLVKVVEDGSIIDIGIGTLDTTVYILTLNLGSAHIAENGTNSTVVAGAAISDTQGGLDNFYIVEFIDWFGSEVVGFGDIDGDGNVDIGVGSKALHSDDGTFGTGGIYILFLSSNYTVIDAALIDKTHPTNGNFGDFINIEQDEWIGAEFELIDDFDGDGYQEIVMGIKRHDEFGTNAGSFAIMQMVWNGSNSYIHHASTFSESDGLFPNYYVVEDGDEMGASLSSLGDLNGDGLLDIAVGSPKDDDGADAAGALYFITMGNLCPTSVPTPVPSTTPFPSSPPSSLPSGTPTLPPTSAPTVTPTPAPTVACTSGFYFDPELNNCIVCPIGQFSNKSLGPAGPVLNCTNCPVGQYSVATGLKLCTECASGKISSKDRSYCEDCNAGKYTRNNQCVDCEVGRYASQALVGNCTECAAGSKTDNYTKAVVCAPCDAGKYSKAASVSCTDCPVGKYSQSSQSACAECSSSYYTADIGQSQCTSCESIGLGYTSHDGETSCDYCLSGYYRSSDYKCVECPANTKCSSENARAILPAPIQGYWVDMSSIKSFTSKKFKVYDCSRDTCKGSDPDESNCFRLENITQCNSNELQCEKGSKGPLCGGCENNWFYSSKSKLCEHCQQASFISTALVACSVFVLCLIAYFIHSGKIEIPKSITESSFVGLVLYMDWGTIKIIFATFQIILSVSVNFELDFPKAFLSLLNALNILSFEIGGFVCAGLGFADIVLIISIVPIVISILSIWIGIGRCYIQPKSQQHSIIEQHAFFLLMFSYMIMPPCLLAQLQALDCLPPIGIDKIRYLRMDTNVDCDTSNYQSFLKMDVVFIILYMSIPLTWIVALWRSRHHLQPVGVTDLSMIANIRAKDENLAHLRFLFSSYTSNATYWEVGEAWRRVLFIGILPQLSSGDLEKSCWGLAFATVSMVVYREVNPFLTPSNNVLAYIAQINIYLVYGAAVLISTDLSHRLNSFSFALILCLVALAVFIIAFYLSFKRFISEQEQKQIKLENNVMIIQEAFHYSAHKMSSICESLQEENISSSSNSLYYYYASFYDIHQILKSGIPYQRHRFENGIYFTLHRPNDLDDCDKKIFPCREAFVVCSLPRHFLLPIPPESSSIRSGDDGTMGQCLRYLSVETLHAMKAESLSSIVDPGPWLRGMVLLPPQCVIAAFHIEQKNKNIDDDNDDDDNDDHRDSIFFTIKRRDSLTMMAKLFNDLEISKYESKVLETFDNNMKSIGLLSDGVYEPINCSDYLNKMSQIRSHCKLNNLIPMYHYSPSSLSHIILKNGFKINRDSAQGIHFTHQGPICHDIGSPNYEKNVLISLFGNEIGLKYINKHVIDLVIVYGMDPNLLLYEISDISGLKQTCVSKSCFDHFSLSNPDGTYFLRPDHIFGAFLINPMTSFHDFDQVKAQLDDELESDEKTGSILYHKKQESMRNDILTKSIYHHLKKNNIKIEWACSFGSLKFASTFNAVEKHSVPRSNILIFYYDTLFNIKQIVKSGIKCKKLHHHYQQNNQNEQNNQKEGILLTLHRPNEITNYDKKVFKSFEAVVAISLPKHILPYYDDVNNFNKSIRFISSSLLKSIRYNYFGEVDNPKPWIDGLVLLPPQCIERAYQLVSDDHITQTLQNNENPISPMNHFHPQATTVLPPPPPTSSTVEEEYDDVYDVEVGPPPNELGSNTLSIHTPRSNHRHSLLKAVALKTPKTVHEYIETMAGVRNHCRQFELTPLYHFTTTAAASLILGSGLRMSTQGQGDGGVYFSTQGPASYGLGTMEYEENIIIDCYGKERLEEYRGKHLLDVLLVYAMEPTLVEQGHGGRKNAKVVNKAMFHYLGLLSEDGGHYLRPDRIVAAFILDPANPPKGISACYHDLELEREMDIAINKMLVMKDQEMKSIAEEISAHPISLKRVSTASQSSSIAHVSDATEVMKHEVMEVIHRHLPTIDPTHFSLNDLFHHHPSPTPSSSSPSSSPTTLTKQFDMKSPKSSRRTWSTKNSIPETSESFAEEDFDQSVVTEKETDDWFSSPFGIDDGEDDVEIGRNIPQRNIELKTIFDVREVSL